MSTKHQSLYEKYLKEVRPALMSEGKYKSVMAVPRLTKVVLNVGLGHATKDPKVAETAQKTLARISGQKPVMTLAKKSISNFKIREGQAVGVMVTLRGEKMYSFLEKLIHVAFPRVKDFRGLSPKGIDRHGNLAVGFREHIVFPEIRTDEIESLHGLEVAVVTTAKSRDEGRRLLELLGFPFSQ